MKIKKDIIFAIFIYFLIALAYTYPLILHFNKSIFALPGDPFGILFEQSRLAAENTNYFFPNQTLFLFYFRILAKLWNEVITYNLVIIFGFIFSAIPFYLIVKKISKNSWIAFLAGLIIMICPYRIAQSLQHLTLANIGFLGFFIYYLTSAKENHTFKNIFLTGLFLILTCLDSYIYGFFAGIILTIFAVIWILFYLFCKNKQRINRKSLIYTIITFVFVFLILGIFTMPFFKDMIASNKNQQTNSAKIRSKEELTTYSSYAGYYFLPSPDNPIFGRITSDYYDKKVASLGTNRTEQINYLGYTLIFLTIVYLISVIKNYRKLKSNKKFLFWLFFVIGLVGFYLSFSHPIYILHICINPLPEKIFDLIPFFRVYSRFSLLAIITLVIFSSLGLAIILETIKKYCYKIMLFILILIFISVEFLQLPSSHIQNVGAESMPKIYTMLQNNQSAYLIEYPFLPKESPYGYEYLLWDRIHQIKLFNYNYRFLENGEETRKDLRDLNDQNDVAKLKSLGINYIIIHKDKYRTENYFYLQPDYNNNKTPNMQSLSGLILVGSDQNDDLYLIK